MWKKFLSLKWEQQEGMADLFLWKNKHQVLLYPSCSLLEYEANTRKTGHSKGTGDIADSSNAKSGTPPLQWASYHTT